MLPARLGNDIHRTSDDTALERRLCSLFTIVSQHEDGWKKNKDGNTAPFPLAEWEELIATGHEGILLAALHVNAGSSGKSRLGSKMYEAYMLHEAGTEFPAASGYAFTYRAESAHLWRLLVARAYVLAAQEDVEFTPLLDFVWHRTDRMPRVDGVVCPLPGLHVPSFERSAAALSASADPAPLEYAQRGRSAVWRETIMRSSRAVVGVDFLGKHCAPPSLPALELKALLENPAFTPRCAALLREQVIFSLLSGTLIEGSSHPTERARILCEAGYPFTKEQVERVAQYMDFAGSGFKLLRNVSRFTYFASHPLITPRLMGSGDVLVLTGAALSAGGRVWADVVAIILAPVDEEPVVEALRSMLEETPPGQVAGLTAADFIPLAGSRDEKVRSLARSLMRAVLPAPVRR